MSIEREQAISNRIYDKSLIDKVIADFKSKCYKPSEVTIYFDLDNTLALFSVYGTEDKTLKTMYSPRFFKELLVFSEAPFVLENLLRIGYNVKILSSCIDSPYCKPEKKDWLKYHFPFIKEPDIILIDVGESKSNYIEEPCKSILVDDFYNNLMGMYHAGGVGIKKTYSGKERPLPQISNLIDLFSVLFDLNCLNK